MSWRDVSSALAAIVVSTGVPGLVGMTLDARGCALAAGAAGVRRRGHAAPLRVDDRVHLGSCTKAMTATHVAALVRDGVLSWGDRPAEAFAADCAVHPGWAGATLEALLQHRGGAPGVIDPSIWRDAWAARGPPRAARLELVRALLSRAPSSVPGTRYEYSNAGYAIAGAMVERALGVPWEDALAGGVYAPLGMATAGFGPPDARGGVVDGSVACGHAASGEPEPARDNPDAIAPAGKACASLADWAKFVAVHLAAAAAGGSGGGCGPGHDADACAALAGLDFRRLHTPPSRASDADEVTYAMGWNATSRTWARGGSGTGRVLTHSGSNTYWYCVAWLAPELGFGVLAASNQGGEDAARACDEAAAALIRDHLAALKATRLE